MDKTLITHKGKCENRQKKILDFVKFEPAHIEYNKSYDYAIKGNESLKLFTPQEFANNFEIVEQMRVKNGK